MTEFDIDAARDVVNELAQYDSHAAGVLLDALTRLREVTAERDNLNENLARVQAHLQAVVAERVAFRDRVERLNARVLPAEARVAELEAHIAKHGVHIPAVDEAAGVFTGGCIPGCPTCSVLAKEAL